ncbi:MAG TPA: polysaccharide biosynthesis tyrosine autokinase [Chitinophagaceae bacterium]|nr:polysaccharide biosynthesis tyrosine autokinase [Chitinophagaceae bacterium]
MSGKEFLKEDLRLEGEDFDLRKWLFRLRQSWYWFIISIALCLMGAWFYLHYTNPVYQAVASLMIKDEKKAGDLSDNSVLKELGIGSNKLVENEIEILRSYDLMESVVKKQQLFISYLGEGRIRDVPFFGSDVPFFIEILNAENIQGQIKWSIKTEKNKILLTNEKGNSQVLAYGQLYDINDVKFRLMPNEEWLNVHNHDAVKANIYQVSIVPIESATAGFIGNLSVEPVSKQASVVSLNIKDVNRERARIVLSSLIDLYNSQGLDDKNKVTANTIDFLNERLKAVGFDLKNVEGDVQAFKSSNQITDISSDAKQFMEMARDIDKQKAESETKLNIVSALERELMINQDNPGLVPSTLGIEEPSLAELVEVHNTLILQRERAQKDKELGPMNPLLVDLKEQVQEVRRKLLANVRNLKSAYLIVLNDISRKETQLKSRIGNVPQLERKLVEIQRNRNVQEQLYGFLLQKREEAAVTLASNIPDSRMIMRARSLGRISPKSKITWAIAVLVGLVVPLVIIITRDFMNNKVGDEQEVRQRVGIPFLGIVSHIRRIKSSVIISDKSRSAVAEQIRSLRTAIGFTGKDKEVKTILVTSAQPGDGKSFISINLAASFALLGKKTLLIELDLRKPHVAKYLSINAAKGISNILVGKAALNDTIVAVEGYNDGLYLLSAGHLPPNPAELISSNRMISLMEETIKKFDIVVIDTPPFGLVTDAVLLQQFADITLVVLRQGHTNKDVYNDLNRLAYQTSDHPMYAVLNGVGWQKHYQGYAYSKYASSYGKGYFKEDE